MEQIKLSILIATMPTRRIEFNKLFDSLASQGQFPNVEIISDSSMDYNIGVKRNKLLQLAKGDYVVFIDDDDHVSDNYVKLILEAANDRSPDCIGISGTITTNGTNERQWHISKDFRQWGEMNNVYYRTPNHISPVRRELALQVGFPEIPFAEDYKYSMDILPLLRTENIIKGNIYHYDYRTK